MGGPILTSNVESFSIERLKAMMASGAITASTLVDDYLERIDNLDRHGPRLNSVLEVNPDASAIAISLDREYRERGPRGPLHGIPILLKDNIDTADRMLTTAGSLALEKSRPTRDAWVAHCLREAGAILLGKTNMSEWANFRSSLSSSGWSARGGQCLNPYALDRSPSGSSSGSAAAVAACLAPASLGTETDGSILCPASANSVVGIKPTVGLTSRVGVIPIAHSQDTVGSFGRTVADAAAVFQVIARPDPRDPATGTSPTPSSSGHTSLLTPDALRGARIGIPREVYFGSSERVDALINHAIQIMKDLGAIIVDPANIATARHIQASECELEVLLYEFKAGVNAYLRSLDSHAPVHSLQDIIDFNERHASEELCFFGQDLLLQAQARGPLTDTVYIDALQTSHRLSRNEGIDKVMDEFSLDALVAPTVGPPGKIDLVNGDHFLGGCTQPAAMAGYPAVSVPAGYVSGLPVGVTFMGRAFSDWLLINLAYAFEQAANVQQLPEFLPHT